MSGEIYEGEFRDDNINGKGKWSYPDGRINDGIFVKCKKSGHGWINWVNGDVYTGEWKNNKINGKGKYIWADGRIYDGDWVNGNRNGHG